MRYALANSTDNDAVLARLAADGDTKDKAKKDRWETHLATVLERVCNVEVAKKIRRDDGGKAEDRRSLVEWLRELRAESRPFDLEEVKRRVLDTTRARPGYRAIRVVFEEGRFDYLPVEEEP